MATAMQPKRKSGKKLNGLPNSIFNRLQLVIVFNDDPAQLNDDSSSLIDSYLPQVLGSCTLTLYLPRDPLSIRAYRRCISSPGQSPYFDPPPLPSYLPPADLQNSSIFKPIHPSLLPLLMTAHRAGVDIREYNVVSERNSLRKLAMNDENFVITVVRFDSTLFLRRYASYHNINKNDRGFLFEQMCTSTGGGNVNSSYHQLIEGRIGQLRILMLGETDAIRRETNESIELKCQSKAGQSMKHEWWLQAFLSGTNTIVHGQHSVNDKSQISHLREYRVADLSNAQLKVETFDRLHRVLQFLFSNVAEERIYMLRPHRNNARKNNGVSLYEVVHEADKRILAFITRQMLNQLAVNN